MQTYELLVKGRAVMPNSDDMTLVRSSVGVDQIHVFFDSDEWLEFPVSATFGHGDTIVSQQLVTSSVVNSNKWAAEASAVIPWEVIREVGRIRVTFQGTDGEGRHIITAAGAPLKVEESGDETLGDVPASAPTVDQWNQAYAAAMQAANDAQSLVDNLRAQLEQMVADASASVEGYELPVASDTVLGGVKVGDGLSISDGVLSADVTAASGAGMTDEQADELARLSAIVNGTVDATFSEGTLSSSKVKPGAIPTATLDDVGGIMPDGTSIVVDDDGMAHALTAYTPLATEDAAGIVRPDGTTITVDADGTIHGADVTPIATTSEPGTVKPDGTTIKVDADGTIHGASTIRPDGTTITMDPDGTIHGTDVTPVATTSMPGKVKPDGTTIMVDEDGTIRGAERYRYGRIGTWDDEGLIFGDESDGDYSFPGLSSVGNYDFSRAENMKKASLPDCVAIGTGAFMFCPISSVSAPVCRTIDVRAFSSCVNLKEAYFPMCETVGESAFANCSSLSYVSMMRCKVIWGSAFYNCTKLSSVYIPSCEYVGGWAFRGCRSVRTIDLPACEYVGSEAFSTCYALSSVSLPKCRTLLDGAFMGCSELTLAELPECETVEASAFFGCRKLSNVYLPKCEAVGSHAFDGCWEINELRLPACRTIGSSAFKSCISLWEVTLSACEYIGGRAFEDTNLLTLDMRGVSAVPVAEPDAFYRVLRLSSIYVPSSLYSDFVSASVWSSYASKLISV